MALITGLKVALPLLLTGLVVGVAVSLFQAVTMIQEMTLVFVPKILAVSIVLILFFPWMIEMMTDFTSKIIGNMPSYVR